MEWNLRTCARKGHVTYAADRAGVPGQARGRDPARHGLALPALRHLRPRRAARPGPADDAPVLLRGKALRSAFILRALAIERWVRGLLLLGWPSRCSG